MESIRLSEWIDDRQRGGRYTFTQSELLEAGFGSRSALRQSLLRLQRKGRIRRFRSEFYVILPVEYARLGMIPSDWFIDDLMLFLRRPYYVGLFSAAALHGAGHQQVQTCQVLTTEKERPIKAPGLNLRFFQKKHLRQTPIQHVKGHAGMLPVSTRAATAIDLIVYANRIGGLDAILTPLAELCEDIKPDDLIHSARSEPILSAVQRLGWLLDRLEQDALAKNLHSEFSDQLASASRVPLDPASPRQGPGENRWKVIVNTNPEGDS